MVMARNKDFFKYKPETTRESDAGSRNTVRAAPIAQVRLRCTNPVTPHKFKAAYRIRCPTCSYGTVVVGPVKA